VTLVLAMYRYILLSPAKLGKCVRIAHLVQEGNIQLAQMPALSRTPLSRPSIHSTMPRQGSFFALNYITGDQ
jgi:hypothetical protein